MTHVDDFASYAQHTREQTITIERQRAKLDTARALIERMAELLNDAAQHHDCRPPPPCPYIVAVRRANHWLTTP